MGFVSPLVSHSVPLEGESCAFPLPTVASLPASPSRTPSYDQRGHPPWNPRCFAAANQQTRLSRETVPAQSSTDFLTHTLRRPLAETLTCFMPTLYSQRGEGRFNKLRTESEKVSPQGVPSKNASERLNLRGRFSIPKLSITEMEMLTYRGFVLKITEKSSRLKGK